MAQKHAPVGTTTVFFCGSCPVCRPEIGHYRRLDRAGAVEWVDLSGEGVEACLPPGQMRAEARARFHVLTP